MKKEKTTKSNARTSRLFGLIVCVILAVVAYAMLLEAQKKTINPYGVDSVYIAKIDIPENTAINGESEFLLYFEKSTISKDKVVVGSVSEKATLLGKRFKVAVPKGEAIVDNRLEKIDDLLATIKSPVIMSIKCTDISDFVSGSLKPGDIVNIILTSATSGKPLVKTETILTRVYIKDAFSSDGKRIATAVADIKPTAMINVYISYEDSLKLDGATKTGKIKLQKTIGSEAYPPFKIETQK